MWFRRSARFLTRALLLPPLLGTVVFVLAQCHGPAPAFALPAWQWPVPSTREVARVYRAPTSPYGSGHRGIDISAPLEAEVVAPTTGIVIVAERVVDRDVVTLRIDEDWRISFDGATSAVPVGSVVESGQTVARVSLTPHCSCVHVGLRYRGEYVNPLLIWGAVPRAVLLPW